MSLKKDKTLAGNYSPVSVVRSVFDILEKKVQKQLSTHVNKFFNQLISADIERVLVRNMLFYH